MRAYIHLLNSNTNALGALEPLLRTAKEVLPTTRLGNGSFWIEFQMGCGRVVGEGGRCAGGKMVGGPCVGCGLQFPPATPHTFPPPRPHPPAPAPIVRVVVVGGRPRRE